MPQKLADIRRQLDVVYANMYVDGEDVSLSENCFLEITELVELLPEEDDSTELIYRLSATTDAVKVAQLYNVLIWSADGTGVVDTELVQEWFESPQRRRIEIAARVDIFPSNSMDESERIVRELRRRFPDLEELLEPLAEEVEARRAEEEAWSAYRRETFEEPREMTPSILRIIDRIKGH